MKRLVIILALFAFIVTPIQGFDRHQGVFFYYQKTAYVDGNQVNNLPPP